MKKTILLIFIFHFSLFTLSAQQWFCPGSSIGSDAGGGVFTLAVYNNELYAAGWFYKAGNDSVANIARWNGSAWSTAGTGLTGGYSNVFALQVYNGKLYAGGAFYAANDSATNDIAAWDGTVWSTAGTGMSTCNNNPSYIVCFAVYNGKLYAGGSFCMAGGIKANNIAVWDGSVWDSVLGGINGTVNTLCVYNGKLYAGGIFTKADTAIAKGVAVWNGTSWTSAGTGIRDTVLSMAVYGDSLYVGGNFDSAGAVKAKNIALWNGTNWAALAGGGISGTAGVATLCTFNGELYAGGLFAKAGSTSLKNIARWNRVNWDSVGGGINNTVNSIAVYDSTVYAGGAFTVAGHIMAYDIAGWGTDFSGETELKVNAEALKVYPNPNNGKFKMQLSLPNNQKPLVEIYNMMGEEIYSQRFPAINTVLSVDISNQSAGIYLYRVLDGSGALMSSGKLVVD